MSSLTQLNLSLAPSGAGSARARFEPVARNAFRTLGLRASASEREVFDAASSVRLALKLGVRKTFDGDLAWLEPLSREDADVRDALGRLSEPAQRASERLFWFRDPSALPHSRTVAELTASAEALARDGSPVAGHDAALLLLAGLLKLDNSFKEREAWARCFALWRSLAEGEEFWSQLVAADLKGEYEQLVTFAEVRELRRRAPRLVTTPVISRLRDAATRRDMRTAARAFSVLRSAALPAPLFAEYEQEALGPLEDRLEELCERVFALPESAAVAAPAKHSAVDFDEAWHRFEREAKPRLREFVEMGGVESFYVRRALERAAEGLKDLAARYDSVGLKSQSATLLAEARRLAPEGSDVLSQIDALLLVENPAAAAERLSPAAYAEALKLELAGARVPPALAKEYAEHPVAAATYTPDNTAGCSGSAVAWLVMILCCVALQKCAVLNTRRSTPSIYNYNFNDNHNYNYRPNLNLNLSVPPNIPPLNINLRPPAETRRDRPGARKSRAARQTNRNSSQRE